MDIEMILKSVSKRAGWAERTIIALVILPFAMSAVMKLVRAPAVVQTFSQAGIPESAIVPLGILELSCMVLYLLPRTVVLGTFLLTGYLGGAILTNIVLRTGLMLPLALGALIWAGAWLRVAELRALIPVRQPSGAPQEKES